MRRNENLRTKEDTTSFQENNEIFQRLIRNKAVGPNDKVHQMIKKWMT